MRDSFLVFTKSILKLKLLFKREVNIMDENKKTWTFTGNAGSWFKTSILAWLLTVFTLGFGAPWAICMYVRWYYDNTVIDGRKASFSGSGGSLFGNWIKWFLLCLITAGIYSFWMVPAICRWVNSNLTLQD
jgi:uncharacterized membrane protein YjgN (DUF898 family)